MNKYLIMPIFGLLLFFSACGKVNNNHLFDGMSLNGWEISNNIELVDSTLVLSGPNAEATFANDNYQDFDLTIKMRTVDQGKGFIAFHSDEQGKGYRVAINNDVDDKVWWRMTGSLISIRNLTKSLIKDGAWFNLNIRVEGQIISIAIDGQPMVEYIEPENPFRISASSNYLLSEGTFKIVSTGEGDIEIKDIYVEKIDRKEIDIPAQLVLAKDEANDPIFLLHQEDFPVLDFHVHLKGGLTADVAAKQSRELGINYAIAPNCGVGFPITNDEGIYQFVDTMRSQPFILAMQAEGREWVTTFSQQARDEFDYVFTDALTFSDHKGRRTRLWEVEDSWIEDEQKYMDMIVDRTCKVLEEPVDVFVNPCYLPDKMSDRYDEFWTEERMDKFVDALAKSGKALEINELYNIPNKAIIMKAKKAGVKFTFGSNNVTPDVSKLEYSIRMKKECGLSSSDMYKPKVKIG